MPIRVDITTNVYSSACTCMAQCDGAKVTLNDMLSVRIVTNVEVPTVRTVSHLRPEVLGVWYYCKYN